MNVLWPHNFAPSFESSGVFMFVLADALREVGVNVHLHYTGSLRQAWRLPRVAREIARISPRFDVAHAQFGSACAVVTAAAKCPRLLSLRGTDLLGSDTGSWATRLHGQLVRRMTRWSLSRFDRVLVMSDRMQRELAQHHGRQKGVEIVPDGIDLGRFRPLPREEARKKLGLGHDNRPWVLFASLRATNPIKRPELARAAVAAAQRQRPDIELKALSGVPHNEVALWMSAANVLLMTSTREGWPNVVKEALASNTPFVATDVSDLAQIADLEPTCTVTQADADLLARGILHAIESPRSETLRQHVQSMNTIDIALKIKDVYQQLAQQTLLRSNVRAA